ncbi:MAG TPA: hypothetical protein VHG29_02160 [Novosphingobium sp.]|nr:hypothetical protein [Novosphingobium sp.]
MIEIALTIATAIVGWFAIAAWRTKATVVAGQRVSRADKPRLFWAITMFWTVAFGFMVVVLVDLALAP